MLLNKLSSTNDKKLNKNLSYEDWKRRKASEIRLKQKL